MLETSRSGADDILKMEAVGGCCVTWLAGTGASPVLGFFPKKLEMVPWPSICLFAPLGALSWAILLCSAARLSNARRRISSSRCCAISPNFDLTLTNPVVNEAAPADKPSDCIVTELLTQDADLVLPYTVAESSACPLVRFAHSSGGTSPVSGQ